VSEQTPDEKEQAVVSAQAMGLPVMVLREDGTIEVTR
jgi:hypothetical protein